MVHSWATDKDDPTEMPRWGRNRQTENRGRRQAYPKRMETVDDEIRDLALNFIDKAKKDNEPFFVWLNPTRMHIVTHPPQVRSDGRNSENGWSEQEAGMAQLDDDIGLVLQKLKDIGEEEDTPSFSRRITVQRVLLGLMAEQLRSRSAKARSWKAASACHASLVGPKRSGRPPCKIVELCPASTGSPHSSCSGRRHDHHRRSTQRRENWRPQLQESSRWL